MVRRERIKPGPGQESVWDYPRPPRLEASSKHIQIVFKDIVIAESRQAQRVLETSHPPVYYIPPADIDMDYLVATDRRSWCEWKGQATYYDLILNGHQVQHVAWSYPTPTPDFIGIKDHLAFYPSLMDRCTVDGEVVQAQAGDFYGGWITKDIVGPFKGEAGTWGW